MPAITPAQTTENQVLEVKQAFVHLISIHNKNDK
jgi:hypothetical protein